MTSPRCVATEGVCHVCADEAVLARILSVDPVARTAVAAHAGGTDVVALDLVDAGVGDTVLVHLGFAIERVETT